MHRWRRRAPHSAPADANGPGTTTDSEQLLPHSPEVSPPHQRHLHHLLAPSRPMTASPARRSGRSVSQRSFPSPTSSAAASAASARSARRSSTPLVTDPRPRRECDRPGFEGTPCDDVHSDAPDDTDHCTGGTHQAGIIWRAGPRTGPRPRSLRPPHPATHRHAAVNLLAASFLASHRPATRRER